MRKNDFLLILAFLAAFSSKIAAQDAEFSQFFASPLQLNPAFAGSAFAPRAGIQYRHQWANIPTAYTTYSATYEQQLERLRSGIGFVVQGDNQGEGIYKNTRAGAIFSYRLPLTSSLDIKFGVEAGMHQSNLNWDKLVFPDQLDILTGPTVPSGEIQPEQLSRTSLDLSTGLLVSGEKMYGGLSLKHLNTPETSLLPNAANPTNVAFLPMRLTIHAGTEFTIQEGNRLQPESFVSPNFLYVRQGNQGQVNVGAYLGLGPMFGGLWWRHSFGNSDAAILLFGVRQGVFKLGLSYDMTISGLNGRTGGTFEASLGVLFDKDEVLQKKRRRSQISDCLGMFR